MAERSSGSGTPKLIQRALLRGTALLASLGLGRDLQPPGGPGRERGEPSPVAPTPQPTPSPTEPPSSPLIRISLKTPSAPTSRLSPEAPGPPTPTPLLLELGVPTGQPSAKSPRREEERLGEWPLQACRWRGEEGGWEHDGSKAWSTAACWIPNKDAGCACRELSSKFSHPVVRGGMGLGQTGGEIIEAMIIMTVMIADSSWLLTYARFLVLWQIVSFNYKQSVN